MYMTLNSQFKWKHNTEAARNYDLYNRLQERETVSFVSTCILC